MSARLILERVAFTLLTLSAVVDATYISWEKSPNFRDNIQEIVRMSAEVSFANPGDGFSPVTPLAFN
jgi:hypothetical protein